MDAGHRHNRHVAEAGAFTSHRRLLKLFVLRKKNAGSFLLQTQIWKLKN